MTTLTAMLTEMQADTGRTSTSAVTAMRNKISAAIRQYQPTRFWFNESRSITFSTVASTDSYTWTTIGTEFYAVDGVWITIAAGDVRELDRVNYADLEETADEDTTTGETSQYAIIASGLRLWRNPDDAYTVRLAGHIKVAEPASDGEMGNPWMTEAYDLIFSRAKAELYAHRWTDPNNAAIMRTAEADALRRLLGATGDKTGQGYLTATEF